MKVDPPLFPQSLGQSPAPVRPSADTSESIKAFAALLSAANQRSSQPRNLAADTAPSRPVPATNSAPSVKADEPVAQNGLARPGRVIDIRV